MSTRLLDYTQDFTQIFDYCPNTGDMSFKSGEEIQFSERYVTIDDKQYIVFRIINRLLCNRDDKSKKYIPKDGNWFNRTASNMLIVPKVLDYRFTDLQNDQTYIKKQVQKNRRTRRKALKFKVKDKEYTIMVDANGSCSTNHKIFLWSWYIRNCYDQKLLDDEPGIDPTTIG